MLGLRDEDSLVNLDLTLDARVKVCENVIEGGVEVDLGICDIVAGWD
jgi:hypothetical protein